MDSQQVDLLPGLRATSQQILETPKDDAVESVKASDHKAVNPKVVEIMDCVESPTCGWLKQNNVWVKIQDITLTLEDKHIILDGLRLKDQHINSVHRLLKLQFPSLNGLRLSLLQDEMKGPTRNALQILHVMSITGY